MRLRSITTGTIATVLAVGLLGTPAAATRIETPIPAPEIGQEFAEVSFAVVGDMDVVVGETVEATDLEKVGVEEGVAEAVLEEPETVPELLLPEEAALPSYQPVLQSQQQFVASTVAAPRVMLAAANSPVLYSWLDRDSRTVTLRSNINTKIVNTHNVNYRVARATTKYPQHKWFVSGTKYNYSTPVNEVRCSGILWWRTCKVVRTVTVMAGVDFRTNTSDGRPFGVTTTYCQGYAGACPDFVKNALNI